MIGKKSFTSWGTAQNPESGVMISETTRIGFGAGHFMVFDIQRGRVVFHPLPTNLLPIHLWRSENRILMSFAGPEEFELWQYIPQRLEPASTNPDSFNIIRIQSGSQILAAHPKAGIIVDNGIDRKHVIKSSEVFFNTRLDKVIEIIEDNRGNGYWFATATSGLVWSKQPF
jgi:hypothetical protein